MTFYPQNEPADADLTSIAGLGTAADKTLYTTAAHTWAEADITAAGRAILDDANAAAQLTTLGAAPLASPTFTGTPAAPTANAGTNTTQVATTAFVTTAVAAAGATNLNASNVATVASGNLTGGIAVEFVREIADAASADYDEVMVHKIRITGASIEKQVAGSQIGDNFAIKTGAGLVIVTFSGVSSMLDTAMLYAATIDDANATIAAGGTLRFSVTNGGSGNMALRVTVRAVLVA